MITEARREQVRSRAVDCAEVVAHGAERVGPRARRARDDQLRGHAGLLSGNSRRSVRRVIGWASAPVIRGGWPGRRRGMAWRGTRGAQTTRPPRSRAAARSAPSDARMRNACKCGQASLAQTCRPLRRARILSHEVESMNRPGCSRQYIRTATPCESDGRSSQRDLLAIR